MAPSLKYFKEEKPLILKYGGCYSKKGNPGSSWFGYRKEGSMVKPWALMIYQTNRNTKPEENH